MPKLIAHRGQNANYPENTLESFAAALACGAKYLECDIQLSADHVPVISHDISLQKAADQDIDISQQRYAELANVSVGESRRFGAVFQSARLPRLADLLNLLQSHPDVLLFIELKQESFDCFGLEPCVDSVLDCLRDTLTTCVIISFNLQALHYLKTRSAMNTGWVSRQIDRETIQAAELLAPEYMFIKYSLCLSSDHDFSADTWHWVAYETSDPATVTKLIARSISYIETDDICQLNNHFNDQGLQ